MNEILHSGIQALAYTNRLTLENLNLHICQFPDKKIYALVAKTMVKLVDIFVLRNYNTEY